MTLDWMQHAACAGMSVNTFIPNYDKSAQGERDIEYAKTVCRGCPVLAECREWSIQLGPEYGVFGGLDPRERGRERRRRGLRGDGFRPPAPHGTEAGYQAHRRRGETACGDCKAAVSRISSARKMAKAAS